jgi:hypothetical protein
MSIQCFWWRESLRWHGHDVFFHTAEAFRQKIEAVNLRFLPLLGNANYDYRKMGEVVPELRTAAPGTDQANVYIKHLFGERIPDQDVGLRQIIGEQNIELVVLDVAFCWAIRRIWWICMPHNYGTAWPIVANGVRGLAWDSSWANWATNRELQFARHSLRKSILRQALEMVAGVRFELTTFGL